MNFYTVRDLKTSPRTVWDSLSKNGEAIITNNGRPTALMLDIENGNIDEVLATVRQVRAMRAVNNMRIDAQRNSLTTLCDKDINSEIETARYDKNNKR